MEKLSEAGFHAPRSQWWHFPTSIFPYRIPIQIWIYRALNFTDICARRNALIHWKRLRYKCAHHSRLSETPVVCVLYKLQARRRFLGTKDRNFFFFLLELWKSPGWLTGTMQALIYRQTHSKIQTRIWRSALTLEFWYNDAAASICACQRPMELLTDRLAAVTHSLGRISVEGDEQHARWRCLCWHR